MAKKFPKNAELASKFFTDSISTEEEITEKTTSPQSINKENTEQKENTIQKENKKEKNPGSS